MRGLKAFFTGCVAVASAAAGHAAGPPPRSQPIYSESVVETAHVPMRDGETLYVQIMRPVTPRRVKVPVILTLTPYNVFSSEPPNSPARYSFDSLATFYVPRGYARAYADVRGIGESSGCWDYGGVQERADGYDLVEWLARRPWSNGRIGMIGTSYEGTTAVMTASERPPHLVTIAPNAAIDRWYDYAYINGVRWLLNSENETDEGIDTPLAFDFGFAIPPPADVQGDRWQNALEDRIRPCERVEHTLRGYDTQPDYDSFWRDRDYRIAAGSVRIPVLISHGLDDYNVKAAGSIALFRAYRGPKRLILGQWPHSGVQGTATGAFSILLHRWFDKWLKGLETGVMREPPVHSQDSTGRWRTSRTWPPEPAGSATYYPGMGDTLETRRGSAGTLTFVDDPSVTEGRIQRGVPPVGFVRFSSQSFNSPWRLVGEPRMTVTLSSTEPGTHVAAYLGTISRDGTWTRISRGFLNTRYRNGLSRAQEMSGAHRMTFSLTPADHIVMPGDSLVLAISSSNAIWVVPDERRAQNTISIGPNTSLVVPMARM